MRLCYIANPNSVHTRRFTSALHERGHEVFLIGEHQVRSQIPGGIKFIDLSRQVNLRKLRYLVWFFRIGKIVQEIQPDILHAISVASAGWLGAASNFHPFVITATGSDLLLLKQRSWLFRRITIGALNSTDHLFCISDQLRQIAMTHGISAEKISIAFFGVNQKVFHPPADQKRIPEGLGNAGDPVIISLRAMKEIYNPLDIAQAIPLVLQQEPKAFFLILQYNEDPQVLEKFLSIISEKKCTASVRYIKNLGSEQELAQYLQSAQISVSVSSSDGTPVSVMESMACGNAVILGNLPTLINLATPEKQALFVPLNDPISLSQAILRLIREPELRKRISSSAAQKAQAEFSQEAQIDRVEEIYKRLRRQ